MIEDTLAIIKPDAVAKGFIGIIISEIEDKGMRIIGCNMGELTMGSVYELYSAHAHMDYYPRLNDFMISGPCMPLWIRGENGVAVMRRVVLEVRGKWHGKNPSNLIHASDSLENARRELMLFFK